MCVCCVDEMEKILHQQVLN